MATISPSLLSDRELLDETARAADSERRTTAELLALLAEVDSRRLYLGQGYSSLFTYCTQALHFSEPAAYSRITVTRAARRFPVILGQLADGEVTLTTVSLLAAHLTDENHDAMLDAARHKSKREVERLVAGMYAEPDLPSSIRRLGSRRVDIEAPLLVESSHASETEPARPSAAESGTVRATPTLRALPTGRSLVAALGADRYLLKITLTAAAHQKLQRARDLLRHTIPSGDPAAIVDRALTVLLKQLEQTRAAATTRPSGGTPRRSRGRHVPASIKREVWARDRGRCAFVGPHGQCTETGFLELHHVVPFATGGATDVQNLELRRRSHNQYEADLHFGRDRYSRVERRPSGP